MNFTKPNESDDNELIVLNVNIETFRNNLGFIRTKINDHTKIIMAAKSDVYNIGQELIYYAEDIIDGIAVDTVMSALKYASNGFKKDIYTFSPFIESYISLISKLKEYPNIIINIDSIETALMVAKLSKDLSFKNRVAVKINFGLNRFGIEKENLDQIVNILRESEISIDSIYSHFSGTVDQDIETMNGKEREFSELVNSYKNVNIKFHISDSACIIRGIGTSLDIVRTGLLPLGIDPVEVEHDNVNELNLCFKLTSKVLCIKEIKKGQELGYRQYSDENKKVAIIYGGYAHGLPRDALFNGGYTLLNGVKCKYATKSFMEYSIIDISDCPENVNIGDTVELLSNRVHPKELAMLSNNIPEIFFTSLSSNIKRKYHKNKFSDNSVHSNENVQ